MIGRFPDIFDLSETESGLMFAEKLTEGVIPSSVDSSVTHFIKKYDINQQLRFFQVALLK